MWGIAVNRRLLPLTVARIDEIMSKRHLKIWDVMAEMGFARLNASLGMALAGEQSYSHMSSILRFSSFAQEPGQCFGMNTIFERNVCNGVLF